MLDALAANHQGTLVIEATDRLRYVQTCGYGAVVPVVGVILPPTLTVDGEPAIARFNTSPSDPTSWMETQWEVLDPREPLRIMQETTVRHRLNLSGRLVLSHGLPVTLHLTTYEPFGSETIEWAGPSDFNVDGVTDLFDFLAFQTAWFEGSLAADFDRDGTLSIFDFLAFGNAFPTPGGSHE